MKEFPIFASTADVRSVVGKMDNHEDGPWFVWGDRTEPYLEDTTYNAMKEYVDNAHERGELDIYGENNQTGEYYEGE